MLQLKEQPCTVAHLAPYTEKHGDEPVTKIAAKLVVHLAPEALDDLVPGMREHFFKPANSAGEMKGPLALAYPDLKQPFRVEGEWPGYKIEFVFGAITQTNIVFGDVEVGKISIELVEGGAVTLEFRVKFGGEPQELGAKLLPLLNGKWPVTLTPPAPEPLPEKHPDAAPQLAAPADPFAGSDLAKDAAALVH